MGAISDVVGKYIPIARKKPKINRDEALSVVPLRNPLVDWEKKGAEVVLRIPVRDDKIARVIKRVMKNLPDHRKIGLDEVGSSVWELCDGTHDVNAIIGGISKDYKLTRREAEASVTMFLQTLAKRHLIGLMSAGGKNSGKRKR
jgi:hypothetical protein